MVYRGAWWVYSPVKNHEYFQITRDDEEQRNEEDLAVEKGVVSQVPLGGRQAVQMVLRCVAYLWKYYNIVHFILVNINN